MSLLLKGSPNCACATMFSPWKKLAGRTPFVRSMICEGMAKSPGRISSRSEPTAENATMRRTPRDFKAAMFARAGTSDGEIECPFPWRVRKATSVPPGALEMIMGALGFSPRCIRIDLFHESEVVHVVQSAPSNNANQNFVPCSFRHDETLVDGGQSTKGVIDATRRKIIMHSSWSAVICGGSSWPTC